MKNGPHWWLGQPGIYECPRCGCPLQRLAGSTLAAGITAHNNKVHTNERERA